MTHRQLETNSRLLDPAPVLCIPSPKMGDGTGGEFFRFCAQ